MAAKLPMRMMMSRSPFLGPMACSDSPLSAPPHKSKLLFESKFYPTTANQKLLKGKGHTVMLLLLLHTGVTLFYTIIGTKVFSLPYSLVYVMVTHRVSVGMHENRECGTAADAGPSPQLTSSDSRACFLLFLAALNRLPLISAAVYPPGLDRISRSTQHFRECMDPFDQPECEAYDVFINEVLCMGKGHAGDYQVQRAVGQCPRSCMHYVTPSQRIILEELLDSILNMPYDTSAEAEFLYSLTRYENNRYQIPKNNPKVSSKHVDWL
ncbi:hypothetical protein SASPL_145581 [Salvia splendens]|uniref:Uncharacterized protein n=1 Tax=Salvia splendens TaxID=180675 RepID=A0A8X8WHT5_SALSN|nr:hypothetical protein SASPL_145581 [Salvia splendens]